MGVLEIKPRALATGLASFLPGFQRFTNRASGGTDSARYCYSVWLRHLVRAHRVGLRSDPSCIAELGPGDSLGTGLAAVLTGADRYLALDFKAHARAQTNLRIFDELIALYRTRAPIPDDVEFPGIQPKLDDYRFPDHILSADRQAASLAEHRLTSARAAIAGEPSALTVAYMAPWNDAAVIQPGIVDFLFSQAVLEHIDDLEATYRAMRTWMKTGASMSHSIDFSSHNLTRTWNGHWTLSDGAWRVVRGTRGYLINREPLSVHVALLGRSGFEPVNVEPRRADTGPSFRPARRFEHLTAHDRETRGAFVQARAISG